MKRKLRYEWVLVATELCKIAVSDFSSKKSHCSQTRKKMEPIVFHKLSPLLGKIACNNEMSVTYQGISIGLKVVTLIKLHDCVN